jgi:chromatin assembly factor 1 subunit B
LAALHRLLLPLETATSSFQRSTQLLRIPPTNKPSNTSTEATMKYETPQILWNPEADKGINAALMSISLVESGSQAPFGQVLATAGCTNLINLWKLAFPTAQEDAAKRVKIDFLCSLSRHEGPVNVVAFSPNGLHLATAGDTGTVIVWSIPVQYRGNGNGRHMWSHIEKESDLSVKIVARTGDAINDLQWSTDSKRILVGTIDHSVFVLEDTNYNQNKVLKATNETIESDWRVIYRNAMDHTHFVQGVAYDPLGVYLASMSSDRSARVYPRKLPARSHKKVHRTAADLAATNIPSPTQQKAVQDILTDSKIEFMRSRQIKYAKSTDAQGQVSKQHLFTDESTLESFVRRPDWTPDGAFLALPCALWHGARNSPYFATLLFARHAFDEPYKVLSGLDKVCSLCLIVDYLCALLCLRY